MMTRAAMASTIGTALREERGQREGLDETTRLDVPGNDTRIVTPSSGEYTCLSIVLSGLLSLRDRCRRFESNPTTHHRQPNSETEDERRT